MAALALKDRPAGPAHDNRQHDSSRPGDRLHRRLLIAAALLAFFVVGLGAFVRLADAGLGCPDWPGCYGQLIGVPDAAHEVAQAAQAYPGKTVHAGKAWKEMTHRYAAGTLGLLVLTIAISAWRRRRNGDRHPLFTAENGLLALIVLQAALGMWTVTLLLKPVIVTLHLLGGMATWATLVYLLRRESDQKLTVGAKPELPSAAWHHSPSKALTGVDRIDQLQPTRHRHWLSRLAIALVFLQIALGGWVSSNYAALACSEFPLCQNGEWWPAADFGHGFTLLRELGATASGDALPLTALTAIHLAHRLGAGLILLVVGAYGLRRWRQSPRIGGPILAALGLQVGLGIANIVLQLPLPLAVAHNLGAAALLGVLVWQQSGQGMALHNV